MIFGKRKKDLPIIDGILIPIVGSVRYRTGMHEDVIRKQIVNKMIPEIKNYIRWEVDEQGDVTIVTGRLDVLRKDNIQ